MSEESAIHVQNLTRNVKEGHLEEIFGHYGSVTKVNIEKDTRNGAPKGNATITFATNKDAEQAVIYMDGGQLDGRVLKVSFVLVDANKRRRDTEGINIKLIFKYIDLNVPLLKIIYNII